MFFSKKFCFLAQCLQARGLGVFLVEVERSDDRKFICVHRLPNPQFVVACVAVISISLILSQAGQA